MATSSTTPDADAQPAAPIAHATPRLFRGLRVVSAMTLLSRVFGLVRDIGMASLFGISPLTDAFTFAFRIPNLFRKVFGEGALATSFLPVLACELELPDRDAAWKLTRAVCTVLVLILTGVVLAGEIALCLLSRISWLSDDTRLLLGFSAVLLPYVVLVCLASQMGAALNALGSFTWPASIPALLNIVWIAGIWWLAPWFESPTDQAFVIACCILATGALQVLMQWPILRQAGYRYSSGWQEALPRVVEIGRVMLPVVLGLSIAQLNTFTDSLIAWSFTEPSGAMNALMPLPGSPHYPLKSGALTALSYGERMYQFPLGVFGVALGTVLFPLLARHAARKEMDRLREDFSLGLRLVIVIGLPASAGLMILSHPIVRALFQHGKFDPADSWRTAKVIAAYGSCVWAYCGVLILQRGFYALGDRITPLRVGLVTIALNLTFNLTLIWPFAELGLAFSTAMCSVLHVALLMKLLEHRVGTLEWTSLISTTLRTLAATLAMSAVGLAVGAASAHLPGKVLTLVVPGVAATLTYLLFAWLCGLDDLWLLFRRERSAEPLPNP